MTGSPGHPGVWVTGSYSVTRFHVWFLSSRRSASVLLAMGFLCVCVFVNSQNFTPARLTLSSAINKSERGLILSTVDDVRRLYFISFGVQFCMKRDRRDASRRADLTAVAEACFFPASCLLLHITCIVSTFRNTLSFKKF